MSARGNLLAGGLIFFATLALFLSSPVHQIRDSTFTLLLSENLLTRGSFSLGDYRFENVALSDRSQTTAGRLHQLEYIGGNVYYYFPPGSSLLSIPFSAFLRPLGYPVADRDGAYNRRNEVRQQAVLAALLMAALSATLFLTARLVLPTGWSTMVALGAAAGTQIWSTASRALWSDSWGITLLGAVVWMLLADATGRRRLRPVILATLLSWTYFVRPTNAISIVGITIYVLLQHRAQFRSYALTGAIWFASFVGYAWLLYGQWLPTYFRAEPMTFEFFGQALAGNLISPARGVLVYVPIVAFVFYLLLRYRAYLQHGRLVALAVGIIVTHWLAISGFVHWHGGHGYGPRLMTGVVPWLALLALLGLHAMLRWRDAQGSTMHRATWKMQNAVGIVLLGWSVLVNGIGAHSRATSRWNSLPVDVDLQPGRVWDWRHPQFLAAWEE